MTNRPPPPPPRPPFCEETTQIIRSSHSIADDESGHMPHTSPIVGSATRIKVELGTLAKWAACVIAATGWAWSLWYDVQRLKEETREMRSEAKQMAADVATIKRVVMPQAYASANQETPRLVLPNVGVPEGE